MRWAEPIWLALLPLAAWPWMAARLAPRVAWPSLGHFRGARGSPWLRHLAPGLRSIAIIALVLASAQPLLPAGTEPARTEGIALVVAIDISSSMDEIKLGAARAALDEFVAGRPDDLLGVVAFANFPDTTCPPTLDRAFLPDAIAGLRPARADEDGTNLGDALAWAGRLLLGTSVPRRVAVLLTDGKNQPGLPDALDPKQAATWLAGRGVIVHAIAFGPPDGPDAPDRRALDELTALTGGRRFDADDPDALAEAFRALDRLERAPIRAPISRPLRDGRLPLLGIASVALALDLALSAGRLRRIP